MRAEGKLNKDKAREYISKVVKVHIIMKAKVKTNFLVFKLVACSFCNEQDRLDI